MKGFLIFAAFVLLYQPCTSRSLNDEDSVVSVYTTLPSGAAGSLDVYRQIADNIAERITRPIYSFFGLGNSTTEEKTTKRPFEHIELYSTDLIPARSGKNDTKRTESGKTNTNNTPERDVEELSEDSLQKSDKKPEKITLFSSYLPVKENFDILFNDTKIESDDNSLELDDIDPDDVDDATEKGRGPFIYLLELVGSIIQLLWGGFLTLFRPSPSSEGKNVFH